MNDEELDRRLDDIEQLLTKIGLQTGAIKKNECSSS